MYKIYDRTQHLAAYMNDRWELANASGNAHGFSGDWRFVGLREIMAFGNLGPLIPPEEAVKITDWTYKNGNPRYVLVDYDHWSIRMWGNPGFRNIMHVRV